jgi:alpha-tubulin suppressor-like RCC1 family protein
LKFITVSAGATHACAIAADSTAYCWGENGFGQLGDSSLADTTLPVAVSGRRKFVVMTVGFEHSCGLTVGGDAYCWGSNAMGQLGDTLRTQAPVPVRVVGGHVFLSLATGASHTCGIATGNAAYCWGSNANGQLGGDATETCQSGTVSCSRRPVSVFGALSFASISGGTHHTCAVTTGQVAYCWGFNSNGQLGDGTTSGSATPVRVAGQP